MEHASRSRAGGFLAMGAFDTRLLASRAYLTKSLRAAIGRHSRESGNPETGDRPAIQFLIYPRHGPHRCTVERRRIILSGRRAQSPGTMRRSPLDSSAYCAQWRALGFADGRAMEGSSGTLPSLPDLPSSVSGMGEEGRPATSACRAEEGPLRPWRHRGRTKGTSTGPTSRQKKGRLHREVPRRQCDEGHGACRPRWSSARYRYWSRKPTDIEGAVSSAGENVDGGLLHQQLVYWIPAFAGMTSCSERQRTDVVRYALVLPGGALAQIANDVG